MAKKVLVVTYRFPPQQSPGAVRFMGLGKYLPEFGWTPVFLTPALPGEPKGDYNVVETVLPKRRTELVKEKIGLAPKDSFQEQMRGQLGDTSDDPGPVNSNRSIDPVGWVSRNAKSIITYPDNLVTWKPYATEAGKEVLRTQDIDAIISGSKPETGHLIGKELQEFSGLPWIADFRDLWSQNHYHKYGQLRQWMDKRVEKKTLKNADALVSVSEPLSKKLSKLHDKKAYAIPNGFDLDEFGRRELTSDFTITYTGQFYRGKRDPELLFTATSELIEEGKIDRENIRVRIYGEKENWIKKLSQNYDLNEVVVQKGRIPRDEVLKKQKESQILLLLQWNHPDENGIYPAKVFEYLAANRPTLAIGGPSDSVISNLLSETNAGWHTNEKESVREILINSYKEYKEDGYVDYEANMEVVENYSQKKMCERFANVLDDIISNS